MLMISDAPEGQDHMVALGSQVSVSIHPDSQEEADRIFAILSEGGEVVMPLAKQFWGDYYGLCKDRFGISWMINYHEEK
jgi:PhnB protein